MAGYSDLVLIVQESWILIVSVDNVNVQCCR